MSVRALHSAASGMDANSFKLDTIANNLANAGTTAFKRSRANFEDLFYEQIKLPGTQDVNGQLTPIGIAVGLGTRVAGTQVDFRQGGLIETGAQLDLAIVGDGFFQLNDGSRTVYTRSGTFTINADGQLVLASADQGRLLEPPITISQNAEEVTVNGDGFVFVKEAGTDQLTQAGQIQLARFVNSQGLIQEANNIFAESDASGSPLQGVPGEDGRGTISQGFLESSNVEPVRELVELIKTQRNFELNSQAVQAADQTLQLIANLRRF